MAGNLDHFDPMFSRYPRPPLKIPSDVSRIPLEDIKEATNNFAQQNIIERDKSYDWIVYKGELSGKKLAFISIAEQSICSSALRVLSELTKLQNIVSLIGICDDGYGKIILVLEQPIRGGLDKHVTGAHLTWLMRIQISLDIASALHSLQNHPQRWEMCIADLNSANIHLDENGQAKIQLITLGALNIRQKTLTSVQVAYADPSYIHNGTQSGIYSLGVILFELLCSRPAVTYDEEGGTQFLSKLARSHYEKGTLTNIIDPLRRVQMSRDSFTVFSELAYRCLSEDPSKRPTISVVIEQLQKVIKLQQGFEISELQQVQNIKHMKIPLEEIRSATRDLTIPHKSGKVYKADLSLFNVDKFVAENKIKRVSMEEILEYPRRKSTVAIKSIDGGYGQRTEELLQTLIYLSHENLVKLVGFCDEDYGRIHVVYEYASNGSLDEYIRSQHINSRKYTNNPTRETMRTFSLG